MAEPHPDDAKTLESIAANVRRIRERRGMTQEQLAEAADIELRQLSRIETSRAGSFAVTQLVRLAKVLGVRVGELLRPRKLPTPKRGRPVRATTGAKKSRTGT